MDVGLVEGILLGVDEIGVAFRWDSCRTSRRLQLH